MKIKILPARREDIKIIQMLARTIWQEAYAKILSQAQIDYMLLQRYNENLLAEEFLAPHIFWDKVVDEDNEIIAFSACLLQEDALKLDKIYVLPAFQRHGIGGQLIENAAQHALKNKRPKMILAVNKNNKNAIAAYKKRGFSIYESVRVEIGAGFVMDDFLMQKTLDNPIKQGEKMNSQEVLAYLKTNPQFFEMYAEEFAKMTIPHPFGAHTISLAERQLITLREQNRTLDSHMHEMIRYGEENGERGEKMHRLSVALSACTTFPALVNILYFNLQDDFAIPQVKIYLWDKTQLAPPENIRISDDLKNAIDGLEQPYCGLINDFSDKENLSGQMRAVFGQTAKNLQSQGLVTLRNGGGSIGFIALASEEPGRFYADMGTIYLERLGEITSATLSRILR